MRFVVAEWRKGGDAIFGPNGPAVATYTLQPRNEEPIHAYHDFDIQRLSAVGGYAGRASGAVVVDPRSYDGPDYYFQRHASTWKKACSAAMATWSARMAWPICSTAKLPRNYEQARRDYIENRLKATQAYFEMRSYNDSYRRNQRSAPLSMDQYVRLARQQCTDRLSVSQLDPFTGTVNWPLALQRPEYAEYRERIERLFSSRAQGTDLVHGQIAKAVEEFALVLKADIDTFKQPEYILGKNFLDSLAYESQLVQR